MLKLEQEGRVSEERAERTMPDRPVGVKSPFLTSGFGFPRRLAENPTITAL